MFFIDKYAINTPIRARVIGTAIMEFNEIPLPFEHTIDTIIIADIIVVGTDFFFIPKYKGIRDIPAESNPLMKIFLKLFIIKETVILSVVKL